VLTTVSGIVTVAIAYRAAQKISHALIYTMPNHKKIVLKPVTEAHFS